MSTIAEQLAELAQIKADIKAAIIDKGVDVPSDTPFASYASLIGDISGGGGGRDVVTVRSTTTFTITSEEVEE